MFDAISASDSVVDRCASELRLAILSGRIPVGSRLPPERRLAEEFDVHRGTVRGALDRLTEAGLLSVRQGRGYRVEDYRRHGGPDLLGTLASLAAEEGSLPVLLGDLLLVRRQLAVTVLQRVATRLQADGGKAAGANRLAIAEAVGHFGAEVDGGASPAELAEADLAIVAALVAATGSAVLALCMNPIIEVLGSFPGLREAIYREPEANLAGWQLLLFWLEAPDSASVEGILAELERRDEATLSRLQESS